MSPNLLPTNLLNRIRANARPAQRSGVRLQQTRQPSPEREDRRPRLDQIVHSIFDTESINTDSGSFGYFARPIGTQAVAGFTKTRRDTNLESSNGLPRPRVMVITGFRVIPSQIQGDAQSAAVVTMPGVLAYARALRCLLYETIFEFWVGTKNYVKVPTFMVPGNCGVDIVGISQKEGAGVTEAQYAHSLFPRGQYFSLGNARIKLPSQQSISAFIRFPRQAVTSAFGAAAAFNGVNGLKVSVFADGILGREIQ